MKHPFVRPLHGTALLASVTAVLIAGALRSPSDADESIELTKSSRDRASANSNDEATRPCGTIKAADGWWFVTPEGERFFSLGVCMLNQGPTADEYDTAKPGYAAFRQYDEPRAWADACLRRLKDWGFTTVGGWSDYQTLADSSEHSLWTTPVLHLGSRSGIPWFDMWDERVLKTIDDVAKQTIVELRDDPRVIGYYSDNEIGWWNAILWKMTLEQPTTSGQRQRLVAMVRKKYDDDWSALVKEFEPQGASSWEELERGGMLWLRPGSNGIQTIRQFLAMTADRYYQLMRDTIRKYDPDAMYFGDRYQSFYYPELPIAAGKYVDVVSTNLNVGWNDGTFHPSFLATLHSLTGKPIVVSEFYMAAEENRSGNKNDVGAFPEVATQHERGEALANTLNALARLPYVVGADWFQYYDEPPHGRSLDGEDYNFGLVDIHDVPYEEITRAFADFQPAAIRANASNEANATEGVPPAPPEPFADFRPMRALKAWDRQRGYVPPANENAMGDLFVCWSPDALYLGTFVVDIIEPDYYRDSKIPDEDLATWSVTVDGKDLFRVHLGAGTEPSLNESDIKIKSLSGTYHNIRCITAVEIPVSLLGKQRLTAGDRVKIDSTFVTHARAGRMQWQGEFVLKD
jgi:hypothetical protein